MCPLSPALAAPSPRRVIEDWSPICIPHGAPGSPVSARPVCSVISFPISPAPEHSRPLPFYSQPDLLGTPQWSPFPILPLPVYFPSNTSELLFPNRRPGPASPCISFDASLKIKPRLLFVTSVFCNLVPYTISLTGMSNLWPSERGPPCIPEERWMSSNTFLRTSS